MPAHKGNKYAEGNPGGGRPEEYKPEYCEIAYRFCLLGATDKELAELFGVTERTIHNWKNDYKDFFSCLKNGKEIADSEIADSLYKRAKGYEYTEESTTYMSDDDNPGNELIKEKRKTKKHIVGDTTAQIFWLKNRNPKNWRDKTEVKTDLNLSPELNALLEKYNDLNKK